MAKQLKLKREIFTDVDTLGMLLKSDGDTVGWDFVCFTCEDKDRELETTGEDAKIKGQTAIPRGVWKLEKRMSPRFKRNLIYINCDYFVGTAFHAGDNNRDTEGCPLVGMKRNDNDVNNRLDLCAQAEKKVIELFDNGYRTLIVE
jgi:hypothetical protein